MNIQIGELGQIALGNQNAQRIVDLLQEAGLIWTDITDPPRPFWFTAHFDDALIGTCAIQVVDGSALLRSVTVQNDFRGKGLGQKLVAAAERSAKNRGAQCIFLLTEGQYGFFESLGYKKIERSVAPSAMKSLPQFSGLCPDYAHCLSKPIRRN